jgi:hypothetical protein
MGEDQKSEDKYFFDETHISNIGRIRGKSGRQLPGVMPFLVVEANVLAHKVPEGLVA